MPGPFQGGRAPGNVFTPSLGGERINSGGATGPGIVARFSWPGAGPNVTRNFVPSIGGERINSAGSTGLGIAPYFVFPGAGPRRPFQFLASVLSTYQFTIAGVSRDSGGVALGACTVDVFNAATNAFIGRTVSDGGGNFTVPMPSNSPVFARFYLAGSPNRAGTTDNNLVPA